MIALAIAVKRDKSHAVIDEAVLSRRDAMSAAAPFANEARAQLEPWACERALLAFPGQRPGHGFKLAAHRFGKAAALDLPALRNFSPDLMLISAGFDAHVGDPLADLRLLEPDFDWITKKLVEAAHRHCQGRIISSLEGGYLLPALARSTGAHVAALMEGAN